MVKFHTKESEYIRRLEESNKDLRKEIEKLKLRTDYTGLDIKTLTTNIELMSTILELKKEIEKLRAKKDQYLELAFDRVVDNIKKSKENKELREELSRLKEKYGDIDL